MSDWRVTVLGETKSLDDVIFHLIHECHALIIEDYRI